MSPIQKLLMLDAPLYVTNIADVPGQAHRESAKGRKRENIKRQGKGGVMVRPPDAGKSRAATDG